jgi:hypothetical protein
MIANKCLLLVLLKIAELLTGDMEDIEILEYTANEFVNRTYERELTAQDFDKEAIYSDEEEEEERRCKFIKYKYKHLQYTSDIDFHEMMLEIVKKKKRASERNSEKYEGEPKPTKASGEDISSKKDMKRDQRKTSSDTKGGAGDIVAASPAKEHEKKPHRSLDSCFRESRQKKTAGRGLSPKALSLGSINGDSSFSSADTTEDSTICSGGSDARSQRRNRIQSCKNRNLAIRGDFNAPSSSVASSQHGSKARSRSARNLVSYTGVDHQCDGSQQRPSVRPSLSNSNLLARRQAMTRCQSLSGPMATMNKITTSEREISAAKQVVQHSHHRGMARRQSLSGPVAMMNEKTTYEQGTSAPKQAGQPARHRAMVRRQSLTGLMIMKNENTSSERETLALKQAVQHSHHRGMARRQSLSGAVTMMNENTTYKQETSSLKQAGQPTHHRAMVRRQSLTGPMIMKNENTSSERETAAKQALQPAHHRGMVRRQSLSGAVTMMNENTTYKQETSSLKQAGQPTHHRAMVRRQSLTGPMIMKNENTSSEREISAAKQALQPAHHRGMVRRQSVTGPMVMTDESTTLEQETSAAKHAVQPAHHRGMARRQSVTGPMVMTIKPTTRKHSKVPTAEELGYED